MSITHDKHSNISSSSQISDSVQSHNAIPANYSPLIQDYPLVRAYYHPTRFITEGKILNYDSLGAEHNGIIIYETNKGGHKNVYAYLPDKTDWAFFEYYGKASRSGGPADYLDGCVGLVSTRIRENCLEIMYSQSAINLDKSLDKLRETQIIQQKVTYTDPISGNETTKLRAREVRAISHRNRGRAFDQTVKKYLPHWRRRVYAEIINDAQQRGLDFISFQYDPDFGASLKQLEQQLRDFRSVATFARVEHLDLRTSHKLILFRISDKPFESWMPAKNCDWKLAPQI